MIDIHTKYALAKKIIMSLPKCDRISCSSLATRYELYSEEDKGIEFRTSVYRCDEHKFCNDVEVDELEIAPLLREYIVKCLQSEPPYLQLDTDRD
jgi:hypothetical protein